MLKNGQTYFKNLAVFTFQHHALYMYFECFFKNGFYLVNDGAPFTWSLNVSAGVYVCMCVCVCVSLCVCMMVLLPRYSMQIKSNTSVKNAYQRDAKSHCKSQWTKKKIIEKKTEYCKVCPWWRLKNFLEKVSTAAKFFLFIK